ncbi:MAG: M18 family aminopeptidase [Waddliaceae bacterium]|nr:M18 family aminopeptidase [Waddliaceae bacterium]
MSDLSIKYLRTSFQFIPDEYKISNINERRDTQNIWPKQSFSGTSPLNGRVKQNHNAQEVIKDLCDFIEKSPTALQAVQESVFRLEQAGYKRLLPGMTVEADKKYYQTIGNTSLLAFKTPKVLVKGVVLGAHCDSPGLKLKPDPISVRNGQVLLRSEVYGGPILSSYFNREFGLAGQVAYISTDGSVKMCSVNAKEAIATVPHLAVHLNREQKTKIDIKTQTHLDALCGPIQEGEEVPTLADILASHLPNDLERILNHELFLVPIEKPALIGLKKDMLASPRLDNLLGLHASLAALLNSEDSDHVLQMMISWDHEEVGSESYKGAASPWLERVLHHIHRDLESTHKDPQGFFEHVLLVSNDVAHAVHPSHSERHDPKHGPKLDAGPVIKYNANQRYATDCQTAAFVHSAAIRAGIGVQEFVSNNEISCGSTIGPISASKAGLATVDIGTPVLSMHSLRELTHVKSHLEMCQLLKSLLEQYS